MIELQTHALESCCTLKLCVESGGNLVEPSFKYDWSWSSVFSRLHICLNIFKASFSHS